MTQQQKMLLYVFPLMFAVSGINFPIGVLIYWLTTNLWSMGQQFYVIRRNPTPGHARGRRASRREPGRPEAARRLRGARRAGRGRRARRRRPSGSAGADGSPQKRPAARRSSRPRPAGESDPAGPEPQVPDAEVATTGRHHDRPADRSLHVSDQSHETLVRRRRDRRDVKETRPGPDDDGGTTRGRPTRATPVDRCSSRRATSRPTTSRGCSTSPTSTATSTWTSRATGPRSRSSAADLEQLVGRERRGAGGAAGAHPAGRAPGDR